jgi:hypothetical protein
MGNDQRDDAGLDREFERAVEIGQRLKRSCRRASQPR